MLDLWLGYRLDWFLLAALAVGGLLGAQLYLRRARGIVLPWSAWRLLVLCLLTGAVLAEWAGEAGRTRLRGMLEGAAPTYAATLERAGHATLRLTPPDPIRCTACCWGSSGPGWPRTRRFTRCIPFARSPTGGSCTWWTSSRIRPVTGGTAERRWSLALGREYEGALGPDLRQAFAGRASFDEVPRSDREGTWVTAYLPLRDATGGVEAVLGVDYDAADWQKTLVQVRLAVIALIAIVTAAIVISLIMVRLARAEVETRERADAAIRESETRFRTLADAAPVMMWMENRERGIEYLNAGWLAFRGATLEEEVAAGRDAYIHADDLFRFREVRQERRRWAGRTRWTIACGGPMGRIAGSRRPRRRGATPTAPSPDITGRRSA